MFLIGQQYSMILRERYFIPISDKIYHQYRSKNCLYAVM